VFAPERVSVPAPCLRNAAPAPVTAPPVPAAVTGEVPKSTNPPTVAACAVLIVVVPAAVRTTGPLPGWTWNCDVGPRRSMLTFSPSVIAPVAPRPRRR